MPANATSQTTTHSGGDSSVTDSERINEQRQSNEQHSTVAQDLQRHNAETRKTEGTRKEETTSARDNSGTTATTRGQKVKGETTQEQASDEVTLQEHPLVVKRSTESGGGTTQVTSEDFCAQVEWEIEITSPLQP